MGHSKQHDAGRRGVKGAREPNNGSSIFKLIAMEERRNAAPRRTRPSTVPLISADAQRRQEARRARDEALQPRGVADHQHQQCTDTPRQGTSEDRRPQVGHRRSARGSRSGGSAMPSQRHPSEYGHNCSWSVCHELQCAEGPHSTGYFDGGSTRGRSEPSTSSPLTGCPIAVTSGHLSAAATAAPSTTAAMYHAAQNSALRGATARRRARTLRPATQHSDR